MKSFSVWLSIFLILAAKNSHAQNLLPNGSFEETTIFWDTTYHNALDRCIPSQTVKHRYIKDILELRPPGEKSPWDWNFPMVLCNCTDSFQNNAISTKFGENCLGYSSPWMDACYFAFNIKGAIKPNVTYILSYFTSPGKILYSNDGYRAPINLADAFGYSLSTNRPVSPSQFNSYKVNKAWQMPQMIPDTGWHRMEHTFVPDSAYKYMAFGIYDSNYTIHSKLAFPKSAYSASVKNFNFYSIFIDSITLRPKGSKPPKIVGVAANLCAGQPFSLYNSTLENVVWEVNGKIASIDSVFSYKADTPLLVVAWNTAGTDTLRIQVNEKPMAPTISQSDYWCHNSVTLRLQGGKYDNRKWLQNGSSDSFLTVNDTLMRNLLISLGSCKDTLTIPIKHMCPPQLAADTAVCKGETLAIYNLTQEPAVWTVNGQAKGQALFLNVGPVQEPTLVTAENPKGKDEMNIAVLDDCVDNFTFYVPNVFTPDGKTPNNEFYPVCSGTANWTIKVYNMWGQKVYDSKDLPQPKWDGDDCSAGVYVYQLEITHPFRNRNLNQSSSGKILLMR